MPFFSIPKVPRYLLITLGLITLIQAIKFANSANNWVMSDSNNLDEVAHDRCQPYCLPEYMSVLETIVNQGVEGAQKLLSSMATAFPEKVNQLTAEELFKVAWNIYDFCKEGICNTAADCPPLHMETQEKQNAAEFVLGMKAVFGQH